MLNQSIKNNVESYQKLKKNLASGNRDGLILIAIRLVMS